MRKLICRYTKNYASALPLGFNIELSTPVLFPTLWQEGLLAGPDFAETRHAANCVSNRFADTLKQGECRPLRPDLWTSLMMTRIVFITSSAAQRSVQAVRWSKRTRKELKRTGRVVARYLRGKVTDFWHVTKRGRSLPWQQSVLTRTWAVRPSTCGHVHVHSPWANPEKSLRKGSLVPRAGTKVSLHKCED